MEHASALLGITAILANAVSNAKMIVPEMVSATTVNANVLMVGKVMPVIKLRDAQIIVRMLNTVYATVTDAIVCQDGGVLIVVSALKLIVRWDVVVTVSAK